MKVKGYLYRKFKKKKETKKPKKKEKERQEEEGLTCSFCGKIIDSYLPFKCRRCKQYYCGEHRLPESHYCASIYEPSPEPKGPKITKKIKRLWGKLVWKLSHFKIVLSKKILIVTVILTFMLTVEFYLNNIQRSPDDIYPHLSNCQLIFNSTYQTVMLTVKRIPGDTITIPGHIYESYNIGTLASIGGSFLGIDTPITAYFYDFLAGTECLKSSFNHNRSLNSISLLTRFVFIYIILSLISKLPIKFR